MTSAVPELGDSYTLMELPRTPDLPLSQRVVVAESQAEVDFTAVETVDVGISRSIVASYVLKPTPKLVWSHPLSPTTLVTAVDVVSIGPQTQIYAVATSERRKHRVLLLQRSRNETAFAVHVAVPHQAVALKFAARNTIYVLLANGDFELLEFQPGTTAAEPLTAAMRDQPPPVSRLASRAMRVEFHAFIRKGSFSHKNDMLLYAARIPGHARVTFRLLALNHAQSFEVYQVASAAAYGPLAGTCTYSKGRLYVYDNASRSVSCRTLMTPHKVAKTVSVAPLVPDAGRQAQVALRAVAEDRVLLSYKSSMFLVDLHHETLLGEHTNHSGNSVSVAFALPVAGKTPASAHSFALYLNLDDKSRTCKLKSIHVDVGRGTLAENLGKSLEARVASAVRGSAAISDLSLAESAATDSKELGLIMATLASARGSEQPEKFDRESLAFLRNTRKTKSQTRFSPGSDRVVGASFIEHVVGLVLAISADGTVKLACDGFLPRTVLTYLFTHPMFPEKYTRGLLVLLSALDEPELLRSAIQTCTALTLDELMTEFLNLAEVVDELGPEDAGADADALELVADFLDVTMARLLKDHPLPQITEKLRDSLSREADADTKRLERMLNVLINTNTHDSWTLVQVVVDVGGLFNWSVPTLRALGEIIGAKVDALAQNSFTLTLTNQALVALESKSHKKAGPRVVDGIYEISNPRAQLDALLSMRTNNPNPKLRADQASDWERQIPTYSREKLVF